MERRLTMTLARCKALSVVLSPKGDEAKARQALLWLPPAFTEAVSMPLL